MSSSTKSLWTWTPFKNGQPGQAGDIANNFRNEGGNLDPGIFERDPIPNVARFLAREFIQNTVDASRDDFFTSVYGTEPVEVVFRFVELSGASRTAFIESAGLDHLRDRSDFLKPQSAPRSSRACLNSLDEDVPLRLLYAEEYGASGMYGPWDDDLGTSKMSIALLSGNVSDKPANAGGSFGHGKSVNAMASHIRVNFAYTCFPPGKEEPETSRRLLGVSYWPEHKVENKRYWGFGLLGDLQADGHDEKVEPWTNNVADAIAIDLGFIRRDSNQRHLCGTSILIVDPDLNPEDLRRAVERYWWPAISDGKLRVKVIDFDGTSRPARPKTDPVLKIFETAYRAIKTPSGQSEDSVRVREASKVEVLGKKSGSIGMCPAPIIADDVLNESQKSLVAYVRNLGMVVKYQSFNIGPAFVNGVFTAAEDREIEGLLVKSEPKTHYDWIERPDGVEPDEAEKIRLLVNNINNSVRREVREYSNEITPPRSDETYSFKDLDQELGPLVTGATGRDGPKPTKRDFSISRRNLKRFAVGVDQIRVQGTVRIERQDPRIATCKVTIKFFIPDEKRRGDSLALEIVAPPSFMPDEEKPFTFTGPIDEDPMEFRWKSPAYDRDWIGELDVEVVNGS
jgi:hypothetical protein